MYSAIEAPVRAEWKSTHSSDPGSSNGGVARICAPPTSFHVATTWKSLAEIICLKQGEFKSGPGFYQQKCESRTRLNAKLPRKRGFMVDKPWPYMQVGGEDEKALLRLPYIHVFKRSKAPLNRFQLHPFPKNI